MRSLLLTLLAVAGTAGLFGQILINNVFDGPLPGGLPKGVELYVFQDVPDLSVYGIGSANNGGGSDGQEYTFPNDAVTAGTYLYVSSETTGFTDFFGFPPTYTAGVPIGVNGDDAIELFMNGSVVDLFGDINTDGTGEVWEYADGWAFGGGRSAPSPVFNPADWTFSGPNALAGESDNATAANPVPIGVSLLPVELIALSARPMAKTVMVKWATASEDGSDFFAVERSTDNGRSFTEIGRLRAAGDSRAEVSYELEDASPVRGQSVYRLRSVDLDGSFAYSDQVVVDFTGSVSVAAFPNPVSGELRLSGLEAGVSRVTLVSGSGRAVTLPVRNSRIDVSALRPGNYYLRVGGSEAAIRFVKQ